MEAGLNPIVGDLTISISGDDVILSWNDIHPPFVEYRIYRSDTPYFDVLGVVPIATQTTNTYVDFSAASGAYFYRVTVEY